MKNFLNIADHSSSLLRNIIEEAKERKLKREGQNKSSIDADKPLDGKSMIMIFEKPSTRTRISFDLAIKQLGGSSMILNPDGIHYGKGDESLKDTEEIPTSVEEIDEEVSGPDDVIDITDTESSIDVAEVEENIDAEKSDVIDLIQLVNPEEEIPLELNSAVVNQLNELGYSFSGHRRH